MATVSLGTEAEFALVFSYLGTLLLVLSGFLFIARSKRAAAHLIILGMISIALSEIGPSTLSGVPLYLLIGIAALVGLNLLRQFFGLFIGQGAANAAVGNLLANLITFVFLPVLLPFRMLRRLFMRRFWP